MSGPLTLPRLWPHRHTSTAAAAISGLDVARPIVDAQRGGLPSTSREQRGASVGPDRPRERFE